MRNDQIYHALKKIEAADGTLTAKGVLKKARAKTHELHDQFDWADNVAGPKWRLEQARRLIRSVVVEVKEGNRTIAAPVWVRNPDRSPVEQGYVSLTTLRLSADRSHAALVAEFAAAGNHLRRARDIAWYLNAADKVDAILRDLDEVRQTIDLPTHERPTKN